MLGVVKLVVPCAGLGEPVVSMLPPEVAPYQSMVSPAPGVPEMATVPVPHRDPFVAEGAEGNAGLLNVTEPIFELTHEIPTGLACTV
jgi:hypothetical protein